MENTRIRRIIAFFIDIFLVGTAVTFLENFFPIRFTIEEGEISGLQFTVFFTFIPLFFLLYLMIFDLLNRGQTPGKLLVHIITLSKSHRKLSLKQSLVRSLYKWISFMILPVSVLLFLFKHYYTLQDRYCGTITVIKKPTYDNI